MSGPLTGLRIIEIAGIGPGPFCAMMLADMGADVVRVDRPDPTAAAAPSRPPADLSRRGRRSISVDLKEPAGVEVVLTLIDQADGLLEGFRPGVAERLGIGPDVCLARNPKLVYGRITGWGQDGPYSAMAGHDINYIALAGALGAMGRPGEPPAPPLNLVGDYGGGGMLLAFGLVCALFEAQRSGLGQIIDASMVDGTALLTTIFHGLRAQARWKDERGANVVDGGAPYYDTYETADAKFISIGAIEPQFYAELLRLTGLEGEALPGQNDQQHWPAMKERLRTAFLTRTRAEWCALLEGTDVCFAPVLDLAEAASHPHNMARRTFVEVAGITQPAPAPRFSRTPGAIRRPPPHPGQHTDEILNEAGLSPASIRAVRKEEHADV